MRLDLTLDQRLLRVRQRVAQAAEAADREPDAITIIGVTKTVGRPEIDEVYTLGLRTFGENRVQDAKLKFASRLPDDARLHMIGSLQSNKAKAAIELFDVIQSVDRASLVEALARQAELHDRQLEILLEINVAGEAQKAGCRLAEAGALLTYVQQYPRLKPIGLMTMAPLVDDQNDARPVFSGLRDLAAQLMHASGIALPVLSMGMSNDFEAAIAEGATHVRIGRAIFGG